MRIAIVGSRDYPRWDVIRKYIATLPAGTVVVSGGARGVDSVAVKDAQLRGLEVRVYPADWENLGKGAGFVRNQQIVDDADKVVAFWDEKSRGTMDTVARAKKAGKPVTIFGLHGKL